MVCGAALLPAFTSGAWAQEAQPAPEPNVPRTELKTDEGPVQDPNVPDNLLARLPREQTVKAPVHRYDKDDYPTEIVKRPLTLPGEMAQVSLDMPFVLHEGHPTLTQILRAAFGITRDWQVGITYGFGLERLSSEPGLDGYQAGKAFSVDGAFIIIPQALAASISFAFLAEPDEFGMSVAFGVPFKLEIGDRWAFFGGNDLVRVKLKGVPVDPTDPEYNFAQLGLLAHGSPAADGRVQVNFGVAFQPLPNLALFGTFGVGWPDFGTDQQPYSLFFGTSYTVGKRWDFGARLGFLRLDQLDDSFSAAVFAAVRI